MQPVGTREHLHVVGLLDEDRNLHGRSVHGHRVLGGSKDVSDILRSNRIDEIVITERLNENVLKRIIETAREHGVAVAEWRTVLTMVEKPSRPPQETQ